MLSQTSNAADLGAPDPSRVVSAGPLKVASAQIFTNTAIGGSPPVLYAQYGRPESSVDDTIGRLWLFLGAGVVVGTLLAGIAGMAVANRAMRPISALTAAAGDIATTRDPSRRIPEPESDDEVAELARTLDQMLRELDAARSETESTIRRQREFVADASHELRTPLTSILANLELLEQSLAADATADEDETAAVASALRSSKRMNRLVGDLLLLARADAGRVGSRVECDLAMIAAEAIEEVSPVTDGHAFTTDLHGSAPIHGNPDELHRMVLNLLENAIRHTPAGTAVEVGARRGRWRRRADRQRRRAGPPGGHGDADLRPLRPRRGARRPHLPQRHRHRARALDRPRRRGQPRRRVSAGSGPTGGARFEVRLPLAGSEKV